MELYCSKTHFTNLHHILSQFFLLGLDKRACVILAYAVLCSVCLQNGFQIPDPRLFRRPFLRLILTTNVEKVADLNGLCIMQFAL